MNHCIRAEKSITFNSSLKDTCFRWHLLDNYLMNFQFLIKGYATHLLRISPIENPFNSSLKDTEFNDANDLLMHLNFQFLIKGYIRARTRYLVLQRSFQFLIKGYSSQFISAIGHEATFNSSLKDTILRTQPNYLVRFSFNSSLKDTETGHTTSSSQTPLSIPH